MRGYFILQYQMEGIHAGIQAAHCLSDLTANYMLGSMNHDQRDVFARWNLHHKTKILLNGGYQQNLLAIQEVLKEHGPTAGWPTGRFNESMEASNGLLTCVGVIIPDNRPTNDIWESMHDSTDPKSVSQRVILHAIKDLRLAR